MQDPGMLRPGHDVDQAAPQRMIQEVVILENLSKDLIHTLGKCSVPLGARQCSGSQIQSLIQQILDVSQRIKMAEEDVYRHQERKFRHEF